jgi:hypothetical protein
MGEHEVADLVHQNDQMREILTLLSPPKPRIVLGDIPGSALL